MNLELLCRLADIKDVLDDLRAATEKMQPRGFLLRLIKKATDLTDATTNPETKEWYGIIK
jgi:hypothetical protein